MGRKRKFRSAVVILFFVIVEITAFPVQGMAVSEKVLCTETMRTRGKREKKNNNLSMKAAAKRVKKFAKVGKKWIAECERKNKKYFYFSLGYDNGYSVVFNRLCLYRINKRTGKIKKIDLH